MNILTLTCFIDAQLSKILNDNAFFVLTLADENETVITFIATEEDLDEILNRIFVFINENYKDKKIELLVHQDSLKKIEILNAFYYYNTNEIINYEYDILNKNLTLSINNLVMIIFDFNYYIYLEQNKNRNLIVISKTFILSNFLNINNLILLLKLVMIFLILYYLLFKYNKIFNVYYTAHTIV